MKKNGFVLIETIVMIVFLTVSLLMVYKSFSVAIQNEKIRIKHNNAMYIYRTYYVKDYLEDNGILSFLNDETISGGVREITCNSGFSNKEYCLFLTDKFAIDKMYITKGDAGGIDYALSDVEPTTVDYLKTINGTDVNYRLIVKFKNEEYASLIIKEY